MKKFAYIDKSGILHITAEKSDAVKYSANKKTVETEILSNGGYPIADGKEIIVYGEDEMKFDAGNKTLLDASKYPYLKQLYKACM